jgi:hypothetical protein
MSSMIFIEQAQHGNARQWIMYTRLVICPIIALHLHDYFRLADPSTPRSPEGFRVVDTVSRADRFHGRKAD